LISFNGIGNAISLDLGSNKAKKFVLEKEEIPEKAAVRFSAFLNLGVKIS
jgi:hypothetical protein